MKRTEPTLPLGGDSQLAVVEQRTGVIDAPLNEGRLENGGALVDLRSMAMSIPLPALKLALAEYAEKRQTFRTWLVGQMRAGLHYGVPPGCEPRTNPNPEQWQHKPSLYKAGAEFVCDLMGLRDTYEADEIGWKQLGSKDGMVVYRCRLLSRANGEEVGQGIGAAVVGQKKSDENKTVKDAQKRSKVAAVLNAYGLSDLFTQDLDDRGPQEHDHAEEHPDAPRTPTRSQRQQGQAPTVALDKLKEMFGVWLEQNPDLDSTAYPAWVNRITGRKFDVFKAAPWTEADVAKCKEALKI